MRIIANSVYDTIYAEPLAPINLNISDTVESTEDIRVFFEWEAPSGSGPAFLVQGYSIFITSELESYIFNFSYTITNLNITLNYNVNYTTSVISNNCAGESTAAMLHNILFSELTSTSLVNVFHYHSDNDNRLLRILLQSVCILFFPS